MSGHSNELVHESSPYLLQHAHNPVNWQPWGDKALAEARRSGKPILVSIGYAACHWCHVMERESFEDHKVAALMNDKFINIKIDREERPDLDHIYMDAVQAITGSGGWPLNVFLTPDGRPFYGGTYFPPQKAFNRSSWTDVLLAIDDAWTNRREEVETQAEQLISHIRSANKFAANTTVKLHEAGTFSVTDCETMAGNLMRSADTEAGGFGKAPKFPQTFSIQFLLEHTYYFGKGRGLDQAELSLKKMLAGGIYDQLGGGMARYSTDNNWLAPHFEKMLYDNALLVSVLSDAFQLTKDPVYGDGISRTIAFLQKEMRHVEGGYYAAIDADSEGEEGKFYVWTFEEIEQVLGNDAAWYCRYYNIVREGNWEGKNILHTKESLEDFAQKQGYSTEDLKKKLAAFNALLLAKRNSRPRPITDDKIILGWNALMLHAYCRAYAATGNTAYLEEAVSLERFITKAFGAAGTGGLLHTYKNGTARFPAFLDDYANYIQGLISLQEVTADPHYLERAKELTELVLSAFKDTDSAYFFYTPASQEDIVVRKIEWHDGAVPSGNAVMARNLHYLGIVFDKNEWIEQAVTMVGTLSDAIRKYPGSFGVWAGLFQSLALGVDEIAVTGSEAAVKKILEPLLGKYIPGKILQAGWKEMDYPLLKGKHAAGEAMIYLCRQYSCSAPVSSLDAFDALLETRKKEKVKID